MEIAKIIVGYLTIGLIINIFLETRCNIELINKRKKIRKKLEGIELTICCLLWLPFVIALLVLQEKGENENE